MSILSQWITSLGQASKTADKEMLGTFDSWMTKPR